MNNTFTKVLALVAILVGFGVTAEAKTNGLLLVGTQAEVREMLRGTEIRPVFKNEDASAMVAVQLSKNGDMKVFEDRGAVQDIIKFVGGVVQGGVAFTLKVGSALWNLLCDLPCTLHHLGEKVVKAACWVLSHGAALVVDGVTFTVKTAAEILRAIAEFLFG